MSERAVERSLVKSVKSAGGVCLKWVSPGCVGVPDRIVLLPGGRLVFVEVKAQGGKVSPQQRRRLKQLKRLGFDVIVLEGEKGLEAFYKAYLQTEKP